MTAFRSTATIVNGPGENNAGGPPSVRQVVDAPPIASLPASCVPQDDHAAEDSSQEFGHNPVIPDPADLGG
ncbi:hypothetical protein [Amycolatopsis sp.]|uniref:hypothetical protein n=1 Tax=Amycolatopsis sp. TaxID=37632 RepID=UPI00260803EF|nr:hypothetical protein [Amycolatopsis sp.]